MTTRYLIALLILTNGAWLTYLLTRPDAECADPRCIIRDKQFLELLAQHRKLQRDANVLVRQAVFLGQACRRHRARAEFYAGRTVEEVESFLRRGQNHVQD